MYIYTYIYIYVRKGIAKGTCWHPAAPAQVLGRVLLLPPFLGDQPAIDLLHLAEAGKLVETWEVLVVLSLQNLYEMWSKAVVEPWEPPNPPKSYPTNKKNKISRCWLVFSPNKAGTNLKPREMSVFPVTSFDILKSWWRRCRLLASTSSSQRTGIARLPWNPPWKKWIDGSLVKTPNLGRAWKSIYLLYVCTSGISCFRLMHSADGPKL